ncbi:unnamed protein product [Bursaphelenchus xylophilus]|uniref:(pine wood nematode) hypothetical protein n=1 Tax=Bursaphelenchus xylophilus TaxID=6326 RepID=A0A811KMK3_BURXY|nr:unnamed protein product [Bursaphelenchus xylophilus]CAG9101391.1 unnamed protein product [Bursaphelenchus xylophilus]
MVKLRDEVLDQFYEHFVRPEAGLRRAVSLTKRILRILLSSNRLLSTYYGPCTSLTMTPDGFYGIGKDMRNYCTISPILLAQLGRIVDRTAGPFSVSYYMDSYTPANERGLIRLLYWAEKNGVGNVYCDYEELSVATFKLLDDLASQRPQGYYYGCNDVKESTIFKGGVEIAAPLRGFVASEKQTASMYLGDLFDHHSLHIRLAHCDGFILYQYLPLPPLPKLGYFESNVTLSSLSAPQSYEWYKHLFAEFKKSAPICDICFKLHVTVLATRYELHSSAQTDFITAIQNERSHKSEWLAAVDNLSEDCEIFIGNSWLCVPRFDDSFVEDTTVSIKMECKFDNDVFAALQDKSFMIFD